MMEVIVFDSTIRMVDGVELGSDTRMKHIAEAGWEGDAHGGVLVRIDHFV